MDLEQRLDRLEERLADLERTVRGIAARPPRPALRPRVAAPPPVRRRPWGSVSSVQWEQWVGQRGLLGVGVILLILAAGYFLKLAFDRGWISPLMRCAGGALSGVVVGAVGWRLQAKGLRRYGAGLLGCGAAIIYVAVWAAARQYDLISYNLGLAALALVSVTLDAIAYQLDHEELGAGAAAGALFAPLVLGVGPGGADALLVYLACIAGVLGWMSVRRAWRRAVGLIALSYFGLGVALASEYARPTPLVMFALLGGLAGLSVGLRRAWLETRLLSFAGAWTILAFAADRGAGGWLIAGAGITLALPVWRHALEASTIWPDPGGANGGRWRIGDMTPFYATPLLVGWAVHHLAPQWFDRHEGVVPFLVAVPYLIAGFAAVRPHFALVGTSAMGIAVLAQFNQLLGLWTLLGLALLWSSLDHQLGRTDGRWYGAAALAAALGSMLLVALPDRQAGAAAFVDGWAFLLWGSVGVTAILAAGLWSPGIGTFHDTDASPPARGKPQSWQQGIARAAVDWPPYGPGVLWAVAGALLLFGVTGELERLFENADLAPRTAQLAGGLSVSAWWALFAGALVWLGFRRRLKPVRIAGLLVSGLAVAKVLLVDLAVLSALYRVASVFVLGLVSLLVAYLYNRQAARDPT